MSDNAEIELTAAGSGKSEAEVAFELLSKLKGQGVWGERNMSAILDMYAECLDAAKGLRAYEGQRRVEVPIKSGAAAPANVTAQRPAQAQQPAQPRAQQPAMQAQPQVQQPQVQQPQAAAQPVHAQQQAVQQAFKQS